jgi:predicted amidohydrolase
MRNAVVWVLCLLSAPAAGASTADKTDASSRNLVENPGFELVDPARGLPTGWTTKAPRQEIAPLFELDSSVSHSGNSSARTTATGSPGTLGYWVTTVKGIQEGSSERDYRPSALTVRGADFLSDRSYRIRCFFKSQGIQSPERSVWVKVTWLDDRGEEVFTEFLSQLAKEGAWWRAEQVSRAPRPARSLRVELALQWTSTGVVWWDDVSVEEVTTPAPRRIRVATVSYQPAGRSTPEANRRFYADKVSAAGKLGVDLLCLGEGVTIVSTGETYAAVAETVPGPTSQALGEAARTARLYVVAGLYEREGPLIYNTALLIDRKGEVAGKYRKTHLPQTEVDGGLTPGDSYPVFNTDFGKVGIEICYDNFFPEVARSLALNGAEIILLPIWGDLRAQEYAWDIIARARAIDNAVYLIASIYSNRRSLIISPDGHILADTGREDGLVTAEINLDSHTFERWLSVGSYGEWRNLFLRERRPETYLGLTNPSRE